MFIHVFLIFKFGGWNISPIYPFFSNSRQIQRNIQTILDENFSKSKFETIYFLLSCKPNSLPIFHLFRHFSYDQCFRYHFFFFNIVPRKTLTSMMCRKNAHFQQLPTEIKNSELSNRQNSKMTNYYKASTYDTIMRMKDYCSPRQKQTCDFSSQNLFHFFFFYTQRTTKISHLRPNKQK